MTAWYRNYINIAGSAGNLIQFVKKLNRIREWHLFTLYGNIFHNLLKYAADRRLNFCSFYGRRDNDKIHV